MISFLFLSTILTNIVSFPIFKLAQTTTESGEIFIGFVGIALIIMGLVQKLVPKTGRRRIDNVSNVDALALGVVQGIFWFSWNISFRYNHLCASFQEIQQ